FVAKVIEETAFPNSGRGDQFINRNRIDGSMKHKIKSSAQESVSGAGSAISLGVLHHSSS
ncbi:MAG: hypothetical protein AAFQ55_19330, partial [Pseudomonadota bacterium]